MSRPIRTQPQPLFVSPDADWSSGICDCCDDMKDCCCVFWCCPCFACRTSRALGHALCLPALDVCSCARPISTSMRAYVRHQYGIKGSLCTDCLSATFCLPCVWCQMSREMKKRKLPTMLSDIIIS